MPNVRLFSVMLLSILVFSFIGCKKEVPKKEMPGGEESGTQFAIDETYDNVSNGIRLVLTFDSASSSFVGTVENVTDQPIEAVKVEVHLSSGTELGPTLPVNLGAGEKADVKLSAVGQSFEWWQAHPEAGSAEHSHEGESSEGHEEHGGKEHSGEEHGSGESHEHNQH